MRLLRYLAVLSVLLIPVATAHAQVSVGVGVYPGGYAYGPPVCAYGYYGYAPYACAPYGYYGANWFRGGLFLGAGPWLHGGYYGRGYGYRAAYGGYGRGYSRGGYGYARGGYGAYRGGYGGGGHGFAGGRGFGGRR